jgi:hypothetical protein
VIFINSLSGHRVPTNSPGTRFYSATKFAVTALLEGWRQEVNPFGPEVQEAIYLDPFLCRFALLERTE